MEYENCGSGKKVAFIKIVGKISVVNTSLSIERIIEFVNMNRARCMRSHDQYSSFYCQYFNIVIVKIFATIV